jgi:hypothetical protein
MKLEINNSSTGYENFKLKINSLPEKYENIILPLMTMSEKLVLGGSLALHILDIMDYDFDNRKPDMDFSLREPLTEHELSVIKDFYELSFILRRNDYNIENIEHDDETVLQRQTPKSVQHFLTKDIIQLYKPHVNPPPPTSGDEHWDKEYIIDFFNSTYLPKRELVTIDYKGYELRLSHPSYILSYKSKYAYDNRVGKQYKHFQDLQKIDWKKYFTIVKKIQPKYGEYKTENDQFILKLEHYTWSPTHTEKNIVECLPF